MTSAQRRVPTNLESLNRGLATLQFTSLSVNHFNPNLQQGGPQGHDTWSRRSHR